jgi:Na+/melibiose symporter-like transporter
MYSIANFGLKMGMTMASTMLGWGLVASGFDQTAATQAAGVAAGLRTFNAVSLIVPTVLALLCLVPYRLTAEKSKEVEETLAARRNG